VFQVVIPKNRIRIWKAIYFTYDFHGEILSNSVGVEYTNIQTQPLRGC